MKYKLGLIKILGVYLSKNQFEFGSTKSKLLGVNHQKELGEKLLHPSPGSAESHTGLTQRGTHQDTQKLKRQKLRRKNEKQQGRSNRELP